MNGPFVSPGGTPGFNTTGRHRHFWLCATDQGGRGDPGTRCPRVGQVAARVSLSAGASCAPVLVATRVALPAGASCVFVLLVAARVSLLDPASLAFGPCELRFRDRLSVCPPCPL